MLRRTISTAAVTLMLATGLATGLTTQTPVATAAPVYDNSIGYVKVPDQVRKGRCASYRLNWKFNPPTDAWTVVARIRTPRNFSIASQFWDANSPNKLGQTQGHLPIRLCGSSVRPGRYRVDMQMIYDEGREQTTVNRAPTYFRLLRRR